MKNLDQTVFVYADGHPNTVYLVDSLNIKKRFHLPPFFSGSIKNTLKSLKSLVRLPKAKFYLVEGNFISLLIARKLRIIPKNAKIIKYLGEPIFYRLITGKTRGIKKILLDRFLRGIDAFVCHGEWQVELLLRYLPNAKYIMVYTPLLPDLFERFEKDDSLPNLKSHNLLLIGNGRVKYKGLDIAVQAVKFLQKDYPDVKLSVAGKWSKDTIGMYQSYNVKFLGFVPDLLKHIKEAALYVHPARGEAFGLSVGEAMLGGLPSIVSDETGAKTLAQKLGNDFVVPPTVEALAESIKRYFDMDYNKKVALSKESKNIAESLDPKKIVPKFIEDFNKLLTDLG